MGRHQLSDRHTKAEEARHLAEEKRKKKDFLLHFHPPLHPFKPTAP
jgi:hypothetical protein